MNAVDQYVKYATQVVKDYETGKISSEQAGGLLHHAETKETREHPMLREISHLGCDLEDGCEVMCWSKDKSWQVIKQIIADYMAGKFYPSIFKLSVIYNKKKDGQIIQSFGSYIYRVGDEVMIECGNPAIGQALEEVANGANFELPTKIT